MSYTIHYTVWGLMKCIRPGVYPILETMSFCPQQTNTFQCVLATDGSTSFVIFLYADLQWTLADPRVTSASGSESGSTSGSASGSERGSASGNASSSASGSESAGSTSEFEPGLNDSPTPAQAGFNAGDGERFFTLPGSGFREVLNLTSSSNVGRPGVWIFRVDEEEIIAGGAV